MSEYKNQIFLGGILAAVIGMSIVAAALYLPSEVNASTSKSTNSFCSNPCTIPIKNDIYGNGLPITVAIGTRVIWIDGDSGANTVTSACGIFDSGVLTDSQNFSYAFNKDGAYYYFNQIHPGSSWIFVGSTSAQNACPAQSYSNSTS